MIVSTAMPADPVTIGTLAVRLPAAIDAAPDTVATLAFELDTNTGGSAETGAEVSVSVTGCCRPVPSNTRPNDLPVVTAVSTAFASTASVFVVGALTEAITQVRPRLDVAVIVVAPAFTPEMATDVSVCPAGIVAIALTGAAIAGSTAANCTARSLVSGFEMKSRSVADPASGTPRMCVLTLNPIVTGTTT